MLVLCVWVRFFRCRLVNSMVLMFGVELVVMLLCVNGKLLGVRM